MSRTTRIYLQLAFYAALLIFGSFSFVRDLDERGLDIIRPGHAPHPDLAILAIDNKSLGEIGRWPWNRNVHAAVLQKLQEYTPRAVALDVNFAEPQNQDNDAALGQAFQRATFPIILPVQALYVRDKKAPSDILLPLAYFLEHGQVSVGHVNVEVGDDGISRTFPTPLVLRGETFLPFGFAIAQALRARLPENPEYFGVNFAGPAGAFPTYSVSDFLKGNIPREQLEGKILLIGATASDLHDTVRVPLRGSLLAGVEWHANILDNILLDRPLRLIPRLAVVGASVLLAAILLSLFSFTATKASVSAAIAVGLLVFATSAVLVRAGIAVPYVFAEISVAAAFIGNSMFRWYLAELEKRKLRRTIQLYFSPQVVETILKNPKSLTLGGERREVTILFSDIRSFTTITETTSPETLSRMLHEYFTEMTEEIFATEGVLDKFIGDAIMAFWGAPLDQPDHADRAIRAAAGMMRRLKTLQAKFAAEGLPNIDIGIGVNTGMATVGNMGSEKRFDYTVIGDSVNVAARLEGLNKEYKTHIIISESTKSRLTGDYNCKELAEVTVKGKTVPLKIFEAIP